MWCWHKWSRWSAPFNVELPQSTVLRPEAVAVPIVKAKQMRECVRCGAIESRIAYVGERRSADD